MTTSADRAMSRDPATSAVHATAGERKVLLLDEERCTGCMLCVLGCAISRTGEMDPGRSRIRVYAGGEEGHFVPLTCQQCEEAFCAEACPTTACHREDDTGIVVIDEERCIGCRTCIVACPFGAPSFDEKAGVTVKCDCCEGDPQCVKLCEPGAIRYVSVDESSARKRRDVALRRAHPLEGTRRERIGRDGLAQPGDNGLAELGPS